MKLLLVLSLVFSSMKSEHINSKNLNELLTGYFKIKNALVLGNASLASEEAAKLNFLIADFDMSMISIETQKSFRGSIDNLVEEIGMLEKSKDIEKQRNHLAKITEIIWGIIKNSEDVTIPVFRSYCPMKKAAWLSEDAVIKNPYYGNKMLSCGKVESKLNVSINSE